MIIPTMLMRSSTLLLAGFWYVRQGCLRSELSSLPPLFIRSQMVTHDGLASVVCETGPARILAVLASFTSALAPYWFLTEVRANVLSLLPPM
jgi:hypothetical protein